MEKKQKNEKLALKSQLNIPLAMVPYLEMKVDFCFVFFLYHWKNMGPTYNHKASVGFCK